MSFTIALIILCYEHTLVPHNHHHLVWPSQLEESNLYHEYQHKI